MASTAPRLLGRSCLVTGGSRGIGLAIASRLAAAGATCSIVSRSKDAAQAAISQLPPVKTLGGERYHDYLVGDVGDVDFWLAAVRSKPRVDILINAAGQTQTSFLLRTPESTIDNLIRTNLLATIYGTKFYLRGMIKSRAGCIINVSSALSVMPLEGSAVYSASKAGLDGFMRSMVREVSRFNIRINNILPGFIQTNMTEGLDPAVRSKALSNTPLGRFGTPDEVAHAAYYLATNDFVTGTNLFVDGGITL